MTFYLSSILHLLFLVHVLWCLSLNLDSSPLLSAQKSCLTSSYLAISHSAPFFFNQSEGTLAKTHLHSVQKGYYATLNSSGKGHLVSTSAFMGTCFCTHPHEHIHTSFIHTQKEVPTQILSSGVKRKRGTLKENKTHPRA